MAHTDNTEDASLQLLPKITLHEALENGRYEEASMLIKGETEENLMKCYKNYDGYTPPSFKSYVHIIAGLTHEEQAVRLCRELFSQITEAENREKMLNATVVEEMRCGTKTIRARVAAIHIAAYTGNSGVVKLLEEYGVDVQCKTSETLDNKMTTGIMPLYWAAGSGRIEVVELLIASIGDVNASCSINGDTALHVACLCGQSDLVEWLMDNRANVDARRKKGDTPLYIAAKEGHREVANLLLDHEADVNASLHINSATPLFIAAMNGHYDVVELLLNRRADVNTSTHTKNVTPIFIAAYTGNDEVVRLLLDHNADVNTKRNTDGATPLYIAAQTGQYEVVKLLLDNNANPNERCHNGSRPINAAQSNNHSDIVELLQ